MKTIKTKNGQWKQVWDFDEFSSWFWFIFVAINVLVSFVIAPIYLTISALSEGMYSIFIFLAVISPLYYCMYHVVFKGDWK